MKNPFYETAADAIYMHEHFDVQFTRSFGYSIEYECAVGEDGFACTNHGPVGETFYIHPDSLSIFEPKEGDLVGYKFIGQGGGHIEFIRYNKDVWDDIGYSLIYVSEINKRKGKPFIMPQEEK